MENIGCIIILIIVVNLLVIILMFEKNFKCVDVSMGVRFYWLFFRILWIIRNKVGFNSFCGFFGFIVFENKLKFFCKGIINKE